MNTRVIVTGGRHHPDPAMVAAGLDRHWPAPGDTLTVVHGACVDRSTGLLTGADRHAHDWCEEIAGFADNQGATIREEQYPAADFGPWPACGPLRNAHMVKLGATECLGFPEPGSRGTWGCLDLARRAGIPTRIYRLPDDPPKRLTRSRERDWRLPAGVICCDRTTPYGNPFVVGSPGIPTAEVAVELHQRWLAGDRGFDRIQRVGRRAVDREDILAALPQLAGRDLACFCREGDSCHALTLLDLANKEN